MMATSAPQTAIERIRSSAVELRGRVFASTTPSQRRRVGLVALAGMVIMAGILWWSSRPDYRTLFSDLDPREAQQAAAELSANKINSTLDAGGTTLSVSSADMDKARVALAAKGLPQSGRMGFELFDKPNWMGSEFDERVNYQRALEGELEHTIGTMSGVRQARVHLVLPKETLFAGEQQEAKASVIVRLNRRTLGDGEADAVRNLVASAVEGLQPQRVTLVDADGHVSFNNSSAGAAAVVAEQTLAERVTATLEPVVGRENVRATVALDYDQSTQEETQETYDPGQVVQLEVHRSEQSSGAGGKAAGIPGTASNAPNTNGASNAGQPALPVFPQGSGEQESSKEESSTFAASKKTRRIEQAPGRLRRMTVAVLVNDRRIVTGAGKQQRTTWEHRSADELKRLQELAQTAAGFDAARGDQIAVENMTFDSEADALPSPSFLERIRQQPSSLLEYGKPLAMVGALAMLYFALLRPVGSFVRSAVAPPAPQEALAAGVVVAVDGKSTTTTAVSREPGATMAPQLVAPVSVQTLTAAVQHDPDGALRLLRGWIQAPKGAR